MIYKKLLVFLLILAIVPHLALAYHPDPTELTITNPETVKTMRAKITQTGGVEVTGTISNLNLNISIPVENEFQTIESISINYDYEIIYDAYGNQYIELNFPKVSEDIDYELEIILSTKRRIGGTPKTDTDFLEPTEHAESDDESIIEFSSQFKGDDFEKIASLTKWIHENINYNRNFYEVDDTAVQTLNSREGVCDEITNLLLASSRALGYKSAAVLGWTVGEFKTEPHSWAEIYTDNELIYNDPTWAEVGFLDAAHIKYAVRPDTAFPLVGVRGTSASGDLSLKTTNTVIEVLEFEQEPLLETSSEMLDTKLWEEQYAVVKSDIEYDGCLLTKFRSQSCAVDGEEFLIAEQPENVVYFCDETSVFSIFKVPSGLDSSIVYTCPLTIYSYVTGREDIDVELRSSERGGTVNLQIDKDILGPSEQFTASSLGSHIFTDYGGYGFGELISESPETNFRLYGYNAGTLVQQEIAVSSEKEFDITVSLPESAKLGEETKITVIVRNLKNESANVVVELNGQSDRGLITPDNIAEFTYTIVPKTDKVQIVVKSDTFTIGITKTLSIQSDSIIDSILDFFRSIFGD
ncbi:MAG: hypothetical protein GOV02_03930 [Candidatus Aenigmarchaeota archaeon]|nr:hypothetical protein [Candidatus Aenigmarchaeota archaeon]